MKFIFPIFLALILLSSRIEANQDTFWSFFFGTNNKVVEKEREEIPAIQKALLQLLEEGFMNGKEKNRIDCRDRLFILTSNLASQKILTMHDLGCTDEEIVEEILPLLMSKLSPEFVNRIDPVIFRGFKQETVDALIKALLVQASEEFQEKKNSSIEFDSSVISSLKSEENYTLGARPFKNGIKKRVIVAIMEAFKKGYFQILDQLYMSFDGQNYILQTAREQEPFVWHCPKAERNPKPPFNFDDLLHLEEKLNQKVLEQSYPIKITVAALMRYAAGLGNEKTPLGAFLYVGPTGVGKTELAKVLAKELMGSESALIRFDMSSYSDKHSTWGLLGATFGYMNHEEGGQLTEALKEHPYCVLLLDEIEKAASEVQKLFLSLLDEGYIRLLA